MLNLIAKVVVALSVLADAGDHKPEKLWLNFIVNPAADGSPEACVFVDARDLEANETSDFRPSEKFMAAACERFLVLRRRMLQPGDAWSFEKLPEQALWLRLDPDVPHDASSNEFFQ